MAAARKKFYLAAPVPAFALKLVLGEMSIEVLKSTTVSAARLQQEGFSFLYPNIDAAVKALEMHPKKHPVAIPKKKIILL